MTLSEEIGKLDELRQRGALSEDEFLRAKARVLGTPATDATGGRIGSLNTLQRSRSDRWLGGVCGGLAELTGMAAWLWRLIFTLLVLCAGTGVAVYLLLWIFVPETAHPPNATGARGAAGGHPPLPSARA